MFHSKINKKRQAQMISLMQSLKDCPGEDREQKIHSIKLLTAIELFDTKNYSRAMDIFNQLNIDSADVIKLLPELDNKPGKNGKIKGEDLKNALKELVKYLRSRKSGASGSSGPQEEAQRNVQLEVIDTALLKCYLQLNDENSLTELLRLNNCQLEEAERILTVHERYSELVVMYQRKGLHREALQLLKEQVQPESKAHRMMIDILQHLGSENLELIFEFSDCILRDHPKEGLKIFTQDKQEVANLPRQKVLEYLLQKHKSLAVSYLEHVVHSWNETNSLFHEELIDMYREKLMGKKANSEDDFDLTKSKLLSFLENSPHYAPERVIRKFPTDSLFEERAAILKKLGRHEQALAIYIHIIGDVNRAVQYCEKAYDSSNEDSRDIYIALIQFLINPQQHPLGPLANIPRHPNTCEPDLETALCILEKHVDKISPVKALAVLPDSVPLTRLKYFLHNAMDNQLARKRNTQVLKGLLYAETLQVQDLKEFYESTGFVVDDYNGCCICKKRFRNQSVFMRHPSGAVGHYSCGLDKWSTA